MDERKKILIVDDELSEIFSDMLSSSYECITASNGIEALRKAKELSDISLILCDYIMPAMNGYNFLKTLRQDPDYSHLASVPVILVGSFSQEQRDELNAEQLAKPVLMKDLHYSVAKYFKDIN